MVCPVFLLLLFGPEDPGIRLQGSQVSGRSAPELWETFEEVDLVEVVVVGEVLGESSRWTAAADRPETGSESSIVLPLAGVDQFEH